MKKEYIKQIENYYLEKISLNDLKAYFQDKMDASLFDNLLEVTLGMTTEKGVSLFNHIFYCFDLDMSEKESRKIVKKYVEILIGHEEHEHMIQYFLNDFTDVEENIRILLALINEPPKYFSRADRTIVFICKCLYALKVQPSDRGMEEFKRFANSDDEDIASYVRYELERDIERGKR